MSNEEVKNSIIENQLDITGWSVSPDSTMRSMIKACMGEYSQYRITELEAENKELREALEEITKSYTSADFQSEGSHINWECVADHLFKIAIKALKPKEEQ